jgi:hypothetical protein
MTAAQHQETLILLDAFWTQCDVLDLDQPLAVTAGSMAHLYGFRGYDAVHCASAVHLQDEDLVAVSGDRRLLSAWAMLGLDTYDVNAEP